MPMHRANKSGGQRISFTSAWHSYTAPTEVWFVCNRRRERRRALLARQMRQMQRRIANGKR